MLLFFFWLPLSSSTLCFCVFLIGLNWYRELCKSLELSLISLYIASRKSDFLVIFWSCLEQQLSSFLKVFQRFSLDIGCFFNASSAIVWGWLLLLLLFPSALAMQPKHIWKEKQTMKHYQSWSGSVHDWLKQRGIILTMNATRFEDLNLMLKNQGGHQILSLFELCFCFI